MKVIKELVKSERGSIVVYVLCSMLIIMGVLTVSYTQVANKLRAQNDAISRIQSEYSELDTEEMEQKYNDLLKTEKIPPVEEPEDEPEEGLEKEPTDRETLPITASTKPYYPGDEFEHVIGTNLDNGLVVTDGTNYWTWVEVPRTAEIYDTATLSLTPDSSGLYTETECSTIETDLIKYTETLLSGTDPNTSRMGWTDEWYDGCGIASEKEYNKLKRKMLSSVYTNGGFWIGQYEMGASTYVSESDNGARIPICQKGAYAYNCVTISQAQQLATNINSGDRTSSLLFGLQWDLVLKHLQNKGVSIELLISDSSTWGNYYKSEFTIDNGEYYDYNTLKYYDYLQLTGKVKPSGEPLLLTTGASKANSEMNIYDLAGNVYEWTLEYATTDIDLIYICVARGGVNTIVSERLDFSVTYNDRYCGFRPALY